MKFLKKTWLCKAVLLILSAFIFIGSFGITNSGVFAQQARTIEIEISGEGVTTPMTFTLDQLKAMEQHQNEYSCINTWPTKKWYVGKGVKLKDLLTKAGMTDKATLLRFTARDGYTITLTVKELLEDKRYRFPNFKTGGDGDGHLRGSDAGAVEVDTIIGLISVEGSRNPNYMNDVNAPLLMLGQRAVTEQTGNLFVKYLNKIEVLTSEPRKWDAPVANPGSGIVPKGTMVTLSNANNDDDKIYYTMDGSTPTLNSPMYNWIARRWWSARSDVLGTINRPIGPINENTTIKAITIGPGRRDSDVVTFTYQIEGAETPSSKAVKLTVGQIGAIVNGMPYVLDAAPYIDTGTGRTQVPVRFVSEALGAEVGWNSENKQVTISDKGKVIVLTIDSKNALVNGQTVVIDSAPEIMPPGRTFVPLRFVSETLGAQVSWNPDTMEITINR